MKHIKSERGQSLVELAVSLVILLYLLSGAVEFGMAFFQFVQLRDAAQEGALYGSTHPADITGITDRIKGSSDRPIDLPNQIGSGGTVLVTINIMGYNSASGDIYYNRACEGNGIEVKLQYTHHVFMPFMCPAFRICDIPLNASVTDTILTPLNPASPPATSPTCVTTP